MAEDKHIYFGIPMYPDYMTASHKPAGGHGYFYYDKYGNEITDSERRRLTKEREQAREEWIQSLKERNNAR